MAKKAVCVELKHRAATTPVAFCNLAAGDIVLIFHGISHNQFKINKDAVRFLGPPHEL